MTIPKVCPLRTNFASRFLYYSCPNPTLTPPPEAILTALLNDLTTIQAPFVLVLDDYHVIDAKMVDMALTYLVEHLPPQMHLVIATREDPALPLARLRARRYLTEVRAADLRFTSSEAAAFLNQAMGLTLSAQDIAALERRTEGWIAGLQLAALSLQGQQDAAHQKCGRAMEFPSLHSGRYEKRVPPGKEEKNLPSVGEIGSV